MTTAEKGLKAGIYCRLSLDDGRTDSLTRQEDDCRALVGREGWDLVDVFTDNDLSGYDRNTKRPEYERLLEAVREGEVNVIVCWKLDRLTRQMRQIVPVLDLLDDCGARLVSVTEPGLGENRMVLQILASASENESRNTSIRLKNQRLAAAKAGLPSYGPRPFGFEDDHITHKPAEVAAIRECLARVLVGEKITTVAYDLAERGVTGTTYGKPLSVSQLRRILTRDMNAGIRNHKGDLYPAVWEPIMTQDELAKVRLILNAAKGTRVSRTHLLGGLLRCGLCGSTMYANNGSRSLAYRCPKAAHMTSCGRVQVKGEPLETLLWDEGIQWLNAFREDWILSHGLDVDLVTDLAQLETDRKALSQDYLDRLITREQLLAITAGLTDRINALKNQRGKISLAGMFEDLTESGMTWNDAHLMPLVWRATLLRCLLKEVVVNPGRQGKFRPERVEVEWMPLQVPLKPATAG